ncbi:HEPN domain-containing protein [Thermatribacter velox]|uniref:HEPN domain-containing protein n=1 Tax=Thermatribacter velox TaxID=3039681 RepID=A0ABZ2YBC1_9BACT
MRRETQEWMKIAEEELKSAEYLFTKGLYRMVCYHAQQAVEKFLKAILVEEKSKVPWTHNILDLLFVLRKEKHQPPLTDEEAIFLTGIYRARYPASLGLLPQGEPSFEDAQKALLIAKETYNWVCRKFLNQA